MPSGNIRILIPQPLSEITFPYNKDKPKSIWTGSPEYGPAFNDELKKKKKSLIPSLEQHMTQLGQLI